MNKNYPVIEIPADGKPDWFEGAYCLVFVYSKYYGNFILKGYRREVEAYLKKNYTHYFIYESMWHKGASRGHWSFWKDNVTIFEPSRLFKSFKYRVVKYDNKSQYYERDVKKDLEFKRLPKRWIPEFDKL